MGAFCSQSISVLLRFLPCTLIAESYYENIEHLTNTALDHVMTFDDTQSVQVNFMQLFLPNNDYLIPLWKITSYATYFYSCLLLTLNGSDDCHHCCMSWLRLNNLKNEFMQIMNAISLSSLTIATEKEHKYINLGETQQLLPLNSCWCALPAWHTAKLQIF